MSLEYPESFICSFCDDCYCVSAGPHFRVAFTDNYFAGVLDQPISDCPQYRTDIDLIVRETVESMNISELTN